MKEKVPFLKNKIDLNSPNKNIVPITTTIDSDEKIKVLKNQIQRQDDLIDSLERILGNKNMKK